MSNLLQGELKSNEVIDQIFQDLDNQLLDKKDITINLQKVTFISVRFLEKLENFILKAQELQSQLKIVNVQPSVYKVFQVAKAKDVLSVCT